MIVPSQEHVDRARREVEEAHPGEMRAHEYEALVEQRALELAAADHDMRTSAS